MKFTPTEPPRVFQAGRGLRFEIRDVGRVSLDPDEQVTLLTEQGAEYDIVRKSWGFYATPSLNGRLSQFGLRAVLVKNPVPRYYIWLIERGKEREFQRYLQLEGHVVVCWLDSEEALANLERKLEQI